MNTNEISKYANKIVLQQYSVTMARHELSAIEMRIMAMVVYKLKDKQLEGYDVDVVSTLDLFNKLTKITIKQADLCISDNYRQVVTALKKLRARDITIKTNDALVGFGLINKWRYTDDKSCIEITVDEDLLPELITLGKNYSKFGLEFLFKTQSTHAIRWYQIGSHWSESNIFYISKEEIRELFKAQNKYTTHKDFQRRLITEPFEEVNEKSDINLQIVETHKEGRSIIGYTISVSLKKSIEKLDDISFEIGLTMMLKRYLQKQSDTIKMQANKCNYDFNLIRKKLEERGMPEGVSNQRHFNNMTDKFIAKILSADGQTKLTFEQMLKELKENI